MSKKIKIGIVLPGAPTFSETFFSSKIRGLEAEGYEVILFVGNNKAKNNEFRIKTSWPVVNSNPLLQAFFILLAGCHLLFTALKQTITYFQIEKYEGKRIVDIFRRIYVNAHILPYRLDWLHFGFATMAVERENVAKAIGSKMGVSLRGYDINLYPLKNSSIYSKLWEKVDKVHTISHNLYLKALELGLSGSIPWQKITPAINPNIFFPNLETSVKEIKILTVARLHWIKGIEYALEGMRILKERGVNFEYAIVGEGSDYERLVFATHQLGITENVTFLGKKSPIEIAKLMREYRYYLQPSLQEGFCNAALEAQACGMLCLVTNADGLKENVINNKTGWIIQKRNPVDIADKIKFIVASSSQYQESIRKNAVDRVRKEFNIKNQNRQFIEFYRIF